MPQFRARTLRTGLLATALVTAVALPAAAKPIPDEDYTLKTEVDTVNLAEAKGKIDWENSYIQIEGASITDSGDGRTEILFQMTGPSGTQTKQFNTGSTRVTDFTMNGNYDRLVVTVCKTHTNSDTGKVRTSCRAESFESEPTRISKKGVKKGLKKQR